MSVGGLVSSAISLGEANVGSAIIQGQANVGSAILQGQANVGSGLITVTSAYQANVGSAILQGQANVGAGLIVVTSAYQANVGSAILQGQANVGAGLISAKSTSEANVGALRIDFNTANSSLAANIGAARIADSAAAQANTGAARIAVLGRADSAFAQANLAYDGANSAFIHANNAFAAANSKISSSGGTIFGDLAVTGNLTITGNTTTINVGSLSVTDTVIRLGFENTTDLLDIGFVGHYANTPNNHTGLVRKSSDGKYYLFDNLLTNVEPTNTIDIANTRVATLSANIVTNVITLRGLDPLDYANTIQTASQANVGAGLITKVSRAGDTVTGILTLTGGGASNSSLEIDGYNQRGGAGYHGFLEANNTFATNGAKHFRINSTGSLEIVNSGYSSLIFTLSDLGDLSSINSIRLVNSQQNTGSITTSSTSQVTLDSFAIASYRSAKYLVQMTSGSSYHMIELSLIHDGTTVYLSQYGEVKTGSSLGTFDASISGSNLSVLFTPTNSITTAKFFATLIPI